MFDVFYLNQPTKLFAHERPADSLEHARNLSNTRYLWVVDGHNDYSRHDWLWEPVPWEAHQTHIWPSQHQANGGTYLIPKKGGQEINRNHSVVPRLGRPKIIGINHGGDSMHLCDVEVRYISDYLGTIRRALAKLPGEEYVWVISSICDYHKFDFTWHPNEWQSHMLHVFASNEQKFGDTFYINRSSFLEKTKNLKLLEWFDTLHFVEDISVRRPPPPSRRFSDDSMLPAIWETEFQSPLIQFYKHTSMEIPPTINLWQTQTKTVLPLSVDHSTAIVPRECKNYLKTQIYDYPYIDKTCKKSLAPQLQDIVYISYDEPEAEKNYQKILNKFPKVKRVHGVSGMENALIAAAKLSETPWYYAVFAKTEIADDFDFEFVPDYFQTGKHYVFYCKNRVNGLTYGHMGMILYNRRNVINAEGYDQLGLDYTLSFPHEVLPIVSCYGNFDTSAYHTWRTAFRESTKLAYFNSIETSVDGEYRLKVWTSKATGPYADWCIRGATDGVEFFSETQGDLSLLKQSFRWEWLRQRFVDRWGEVD